MKAVTGVAVLLALYGCAGGEKPAPPPEDTTALVPSVPAGAGETIVFLGTSITAGLGLDPDQAYPAVIEEWLDSAGMDYRVINAGVSGETSAGALGRIDWILQQQPVVLLLETGANDGLRGQPPEAVKANLQAIIDRVRARSPGTRVILAGMQALPNLGRRYTERFAAIYPEVARENNIPLIPFILDGVGGVDSLNQADGIHPTPAGQRVVAANVWPVLEPVLRAAAGEPTPGS